ncbi:MAG: hypothetical protein WCT16_01700 [Candidatus Buchananbacteria bacterium]
MALCINCSGTILKPGSPAGSCAVTGCNNLATHKDYEYCPHCAEELGRCECCGKRQEKQHQIEI